MTGVPFEDFLNATFTEEMAKQGAHHSEQSNVY